jgi:phenylacetate-CoA ligase
MKIASLYDNLPIFLQNIAVSSYGLKIARREYGKGLWNLLKEFETIQWYSDTELGEYQSEKLKSLIEHSYDSVPYYRTKMDERHLKPEDIARTHDLYKLPILTKEDIRNNLNDLISRNTKASRLISGHTSGTTGSPLHFYYDNDICRIKTALEWRQKRWAGINPGDRIAFFLGRMIVPTAQRKPPFWRLNWFLNHLFFSSFHLSPATADSYIDKLIDFDPKAVEGYPSTMYLIAKLLLSRNRPLKLKAVFTSSETLLPQQREAIETAFGCKLFDFYGLAERVAFSTECEGHCGHHVNSDFGILELLDSKGNAVPLGKLGKMVSTGLHNYAMPLIRYQTNDLTSLNPEFCKCGRKFPLMSDVTTKAEDIITTRDGRFISPSILTHPFKPMKGIQESQIIQEELDHITIKLVKISASEEIDTTRLIFELQKRLGEDMSISIQFVDKIPRTDSGKLRWVISKIPLEIN